MLFENRDEITKGVRGDRIDPDPFGDPGSDQTEPFLTSDSEHAVSRQRETAYQKELTNTHGRV